MIRKANALEILSEFRYENRRPSKFFQNSATKVCVAENGTFLDAPGKSLSPIPQRAFSLLELLVVIGIIVLLSALAVPALNSVLQGGRLSQATTQIISTFSLAMQRATSENRAVTVRILARPDGGKFRYLQLLGRQPDGTFQPLDRLVEIPDTAQIATAPALTSFFNRPVQTAGADDPALPSLGAGYRFVEFQIRPDGRLSLDVDEKWFITLFAEREDPGITSPPDNFATVQIDPVNGGISFFRP